MLDVAAVRWCWTFSGPRNRAIHEYQNKKSWFLKYSLGPVDCLDGIFFTNLTPDDLFICLHNRRTEWKHWFHFFEEVSIYCKLSRHYLLGIISRFSLLRKGKLRFPNCVSFVDKETNHLGSGSWKRYSLVRMCTLYFFESLDYALKSASFMLWLCSVFL